MKINLVFFDSLKNSKKGLLKGFLIYPISFLTLCLIDLLVTKKQTTFAVIDVFLTALILVSALGVSAPKSYKASAFYGASVGFVVSAVLFFQTAVFLDSFTFDSFLIVLILTLSCAVQNVFLFFTGIQFN